MTITRSDRSYALVMLTIIYVFNFIDRQILVILQEPIKMEMGLSDAQLGLLTGFAFAIFYVIAGIPLAWWADRWIRRNIIVISLTIWSSMTALSGFAQNYTHLLLARIGVGVGEAGGSPPAHAMITDYFPAEKRATALAIYSMGIYIGVLIGYFLGGVISQYFSWRAAFFVVGVPGIFLALIVKFTVKEPPRGHSDQNFQAAPALPLRQTLRYLGDRPTFLRLSLGCALATFVAYGTGNFMPSYLIRSHHMSLVEIGYILSLVVGIAGASGTYFGGVIADRLGQRDYRWYLWVPAASLAAAVPINLFVTLSNHTTFVLVGIFFAIALSTMYFGAAIAVSHMLVPPTMKALVSSILFLISNLIGLGLGPVATGVLSDFLAAPYGTDGLRYAMAFAALAGIPAAGLFVLAARQLPADIVRSGKIDGRPEHQL